MNKMKQSKLQKIKQFDPSDVGLLSADMYGLPFTPDESEIVVVPMPWEVTVSYRAGTAQGPETMRNASYQVDLYEPSITNAWHAGVSLLPISDYWMRKNNILREKAKKCIRNLENGGSVHDKKVVPLYREINNAGAELNAWMKKETSKWLDLGKSVCVIGGEHSVPLGFIHALAERHSDFSVLHIDAHADLREAYEGFEFSHASIQYNALKIPQVKTMVVVGIRDYSEQEANRIASSKGRIAAFEDRMIKHALYEGSTWEKLTEKILKPLHKKVYISFDIDALDPALCPHTGTPVPGGLEFEQVMYLVERLVKSGHEIIGFDLCEVAPAPDDDWDSVVGARALYRLVNLMAKSQGKFAK